MVCRNLYLRISANLASNVAHTWNYVNLKQEFLCYTSCRPFYSPHFSLRNEKIQPSYHLFAHYISFSEPLSPSSISLFSGLSPLQSPSPMCTYTWDALCNVRRKNDSHSLQITYLFGSSVWLPTVFVYNTVPDFCFCKLHVSRQVLMDWSI